MTETLPRLPSLAALYLRLPATARRSPGKNIRIPRLGVKVRAQHASASRLAAYREVCGMDASTHLPITFPQVQAMPLHLWLMVRPEFPVPLVGVVHLRNHFELLCPMPTDQEFDVHAALAGGRRTHQGYEFDVITEYTADDGKPVYRSLMTLLHRMKSGQRSPRPAPAAAELSEYRSFEVPADTGRRYAPVSGDFNPIHLFALSARIFGFPRAIAQGMWTAARIAGLLEEARGEALTTLDVQFRPPLLLPSKVTLKFDALDGGRSFALLSRTADKVHCTGSAG
ncbi:MAG: MaoC family dehydratase [Panacagrimonas sp.]